MRALHASTARTDFRSFIEYILQMMLNDIVSSNANDHVTA